MVNVKDVAVGAAIATIVGQALTSDGSDDGSTNGSDGDNNGTVEPTTTATDGGTAEGSAVDQLVEFKRKNEAPPEALDSYVGRTVDIPAGGSATVTVTPEDGYDLRVKKLYFDRRSNHSYTFVVGGNQLSENHQLVLESPRKSTQSGKIVAEAVNNASSSSTQDFEMHGWAVPSGVQG